MSLQEQDDIYFDTPSMEKEKMMNVEVGDDERKIRR